jgi:hypothetical protein
MSTRTAQERRDNAIPSRYKMPLHPASLTTEDVEALIPANGVWVAPSLQNGWVDYGAGIQGVQYMKDANGFVHIRGVMKDGTASAGTLVFTLPVGFRPPARIHIVAIANEDVEAMDLYADGSVKIKQNSSATYWSFGSIQFSTEA